MSGTNSSSDKEKADALEREKARLNMKRKRYVMTDDEEDDVVVVKKCTILSDRLEVASVFGQSSDIVTSTWFKHRGSRVLSTEVEIGAMLAVPVDVPIKMGIIIQLVHLQC